LSGASDRTRISAYVEEQQTKARAENALERAAVVNGLEVKTDEGPNWKIRFTGVLAHEGSVSRDDPDAYVTTSGKVILAYQDRAPRGVRNENVVVFDSYDDFVDAAPPNRVLVAAVAQVLGEEWIEEID
jgi:hypothetical protein